MKKKLAEDMILFIKPVREKAKAIQDDKEYLSNIIKLGKDKAQESAAKTLALVRSAIGVQYV
jgi:tryptophanyl-tRNA synthetase